MLMPMLCAWTCSHVTPAQAGQPWQVFHNCLWNFGTSDAQAEPLGGGQLLGSGRMWVSPSGEVDPRAVKVRFEGRNLPTETLLKRYLPKVSPPPTTEGCPLLAARPGAVSGAYAGTLRRLSLFVSSLWSLGDPRACDGLCQSTR